MTTRLGAPLKREIEIDGKPYTLTIDPDGLALVLKGRRKGLELKWHDLVSGDAALTTALNASLTARLTPPAAASKRTTERPGPKPAATQNRTRKRPKQ
jgi:hypothetical protein